jgi:hypothetical protein
MVHGKEEREAKRDDEKKTITLNCGLDNIIPYLERQRGLTSSSF